MKICSTLILALLAAQPGLTLQGDDCHLAVDLSLHDGNDLIFNDGFEP